MQYFSTRDESKTPYSASQVILQGLADDGGLFFPESLPALTADDLSKLTKMNYPARAADILGRFLTDFSADELLTAAKKAYSPSRFSAPPVITTKLDENYLLELWHGPTSAFKDMALQIMPHLLALSLQKTGEKRDALILVATSGDTGKAALEGFADQDRVKILVFYPVHGVSDIQKRQMQTQKGKNVGVIAIEGNFDDAQSGVKAIFSDPAVVSAVQARGYFFSSANSINFGRLAPQIVYYVSAYCDLVKNKEIALGDTIDVTVPTGNFGNILAAYMAKKMGVPLGKLICASNRNNILTDFFNTGVYDKRRPFYTTVSPSMDILISSNLERLLYCICGPTETAGYMRSLRETGCFAVTSDVLEIFRRDFAAYFCDEEQTASTVASTFDTYHYVCDTHTAVAVSAAAQYRAANACGKMLIASTASPYKFSPAVCKALHLSYSGNEFSAIDALSAASEMPVPPRLAALKDAERRYDTTVRPEEMPRAVLDFLG